MLCLDRQFVTLPGDTIERIVVCTLPKYHEGCHIYELAFEVRFTIVPIEQLAGGAA